MPIVWRPADAKLKDELERKRREVEALRFRPKPVVWSPNAQMRAARPGDANYTPTIQDRLAEQATENAVLSFSQRLAQARRTNTTPFVPSQFTGQGVSPGAQVVSSGMGQTLPPWMVSFKPNQPPMTVGEGLDIVNRNVIEPLGMTTIGAGTTGFSEGLRMLNPVARVAGANVAQGARAAGTRTAQLGREIATNEAGFAKIPGKGNWKKVEIPLNFRGREEQWILEQPNPAAFRRNYGGPGEGMIVEEVIPTAAQMKKAAQAREAQILADSNKKFADEIASTETISQREARRKLEKQAAFKGEPTPVTHPESGAKPQPVAPKAGEALPLVPEGYGVNPDYIPPEQLTVRENVGKKTIQDVLVNKSTGKDIAPIANMNQKERYLREGYGAPYFPKADLPEPPLTKAEAPAAIGKVPEPPVAKLADTVPAETPPVTPKAAEGGIPPVEPPKPPVDTTIPEPQPTDKPGFAGNIRLSKYPEELRPALKQWAEDNIDTIAKVRRGTRTDAMVKADAEVLASEVGGDLAKLQKRWKPGEAWNAEEVLALRGVLRTKTEAVLDAQRLVRQGNSTENLIKLKLALDDQAATQEMVTGVTAEAGRALRQFRQAAIEASGDVTKMERLLKQVGGRDNIEDIAELLGNLDVNDPVVVNNFVRNLQKKDFWDYVTELYYNSILSGPKTHVVNSLSNTVNMLAAPVERAFAAAVDVPLSKLQGRQRARFFSEIPADTFGAIEGVKEGLRAFGTTMKTGVSPLNASKFEMQQTRAFKGKLGRVINVPSTSLEAADALMQQVNYRAAFNATAKRIISRRGLKGQEAIEALADLKASPTKPLLEQAREISEYRLYRGDPGKFTEAIMGLREKVTIGGFEPLRYVVPFVRTPANLLKYGLERSPAGWLNPKLWKNIAAKNPEAADQIGRAVIGSLTAVGIAIYAREGLITGAAPSNAAERDRFYRNGKQPFSLRVGDKWVSYQRMEPFNQTFALVSAAVDALSDKSKNAGDLAKQAGTTIAQNMVSQTYLSGLSDVINMISEPERFAGSIIENFAGALVVPASSLTRTAAQVMDRTVRAPENFGQKLQSGVPSLSKNVPAKLDAFGNEIVRESPAFLPINVTTAKETYLTQELDRLKVNVGFVGDSIQNIKLTSEEQRWYQEGAGLYTKQELERVIALPSYQAGSDDFKRQYIEKAISYTRDKAKQAALRYVQQNDPERYRASLSR